MGTTDDYLLRLRKLAVLQYLERITNYPVEPPNSEPYLRLLQNGLDRVDLGFSFPGDDVKDAGLRRDLLNAEVYLNARRAEIIAAAEAKVAELSQKIPPAGN